MNVHFLITFIIVNISSPSLQFQNNIICLLSEDDNSSESRSSSSSICSEYSVDDKSTKVVAPNRPYIYRTCKSKTTPIHHQINSKIVGQNTRDERNDTSSEAIIDLDADNADIGKQPGNKFNSNNQRAGLRSFNMPAFNLDLDPDYLDSNHEDPPVSSHSTIIKAQCKFFKETLMGKPPLASFNNEQGLINASSPHAPLIPWTGADGVSLVCNMMLPRHFSK